MNTQMMTYAELAERLGIQLSSARKLTRRKKWARSNGNDGTVRVTVPLDELPHRDTSQPEPAAPVSDDALRVASLEAEVSGLRETIASEAKRADAAEADRDAWRALATRPWWKKITG